MLPQVKGEAMYVWLFASVLVGCEQVAPDGDPLKPVIVDVSEPKEASAEMEEAESEEDEVFSISSEELAAIADGASVEEKPTKVVETAVPQKDAPVAETVQSPPTVEPVAPVAPAAPAAPMNNGWGEVIGKAWPVRLVTTVPNATPPRAILGLPDGREVVVNPGSMVPDMGLVVVAIAPNSAEVARIAPAGDHATIETMTLRAQY